MSNSRTIKKTKSVPFSLSDVMYLESIQKSKGMSFSGAVRYCIAEVRRNTHEANRLAQIQKQINKLPEKIASLLIDEDEGVQS